MTKPSINFKGDFVQIIDGQSAPTKETRHGLNPANLQEMDKVPVATQQDLDRVVAAAKKAFKTWSKIPYEERRDSVLAFADAVDSHRDEFQALLTAEQGKPVGIGETALNLMLTKLMPVRFPKLRMKPTLLSNGCVAWLRSPFQKMFLRTLSNAPSLAATRLLEWLQLSCPGTSLFCLPQARSLRHY
ncbi:hypothetical protein LB503_008433 [Fusarium chuoi]|nr:hypothetical protein LB503_008433 [Fusarium chuoi]